MYTLRFVPAVELPASTARIVKAVARTDIEARQSLPINPLAANGLTDTEYNKRPPYERGTSEAKEEENGDAGNVEDSKDDGGGKLAVVNALKAGVVDRRGGHKRRRQDRERQWR